MNDELKIAMLLQQLNESAFQIFQHAIIPDVDKLSYDRYIVHVRDQFGPRESEQELRLNFRSMGSRQHNLLTSTITHVSLRWHRGHSRGRIKLSLMDS